MMRWKMWLNNVYRTIRSTASEDATKQDESAVRACQKTSMKLQSTELQTHGLAKGLGID